MYGNDISGGSLAMTGVAVSAAHSVMLGVVLVLAGFALLTTAKILKHRSKK